MRNPIPRSSKRFSHITGLSITHEGFGSEIQIQTPDVSANGMFIHTAVRFPEGSVIRVNFRLQRSQFEVKTRAEVRYCLPGVGIGVEFIGISDEAARAIGEEIGQFCLE
jgi:hypothetical protein